MKNILLCDSYGYIMFWLVVDLPSENMSSSVGIMNFPIYGKS